VEKESPFGARKREVKSWNGLFISKKEGFLKEGLGAANPYGARE